MNKYLEKLGSAQKLDAEIAKNAVMQMKLAESFTELDDFYRAAIIEQIHDELGGEWRYHDNKVVHPRHKITISFDITTHDQYLLMLVDRFGVNIETRIEGIESFISAAVQLAALYSMRSSYES
jgi:hypothetical protein